MINKILAALFTGGILLMTTISSLSGNTSAREIYVPAQVVECHAEPGTNVVSVLCYGDVKGYDGQIYDSTSFNYIPKGTDVTVILNDKGTKKVTDDEVINIVWERE